MLHWYMQQRVATSCTPYENLSPVLDAKRCIVSGHCRVVRRWALLSDIQALMPTSVSKLSNVRPVSMLPSRPKAPAQHNNKMS